MLFFDWTNYISKNSNTVRYEINTIFFAVLKNNNGIVPALPYQADMLEKDWMIVE